MATQGRTIILVSGGNAGIGYEIVKALAAFPSYQILMGCRDTHKGEDAVASMGAPLNVNPIQLDITDDASIEHCFLAIQQHFGRLDVLINNAGTAGEFMEPGATLRDKFNLCMSVNVTSTAILTERLVPLLEKSRLPKIIFISSTLASIGFHLQHGVTYKGPWYNSSKTAVNALAVYYAKLYPEWKINTVCPGHRATGLNGIELTEDTDPKLGAVRAVELVKDGPDGVTATFSRAGEEIPW